MFFSETTATKKITSLKKRIRIVQGGTSASKTVSIILFLIARAQTDTVKTLTSVVSESVPHLKRGALRDFKNILKNHNYWKEASWNATDSIYTFETGSQIEFFSADNASKLRGGRRDRLFLNEANNIFFNAFEELEVRTREFIFIDYNPTAEFWAMTEVKGRRDDVDFLILNYRDNEALDKRIVASIEARRNNKNWWRVYGEGLLGEVEGRIYTGWQIIDDIPHEARLERRGLDFGYSVDPTVIIDVYRYNGGFILDELVYQKGLSNKAIADIINNQPQPKTLVVGDSAEPKSIDEIASYGVPIIGADKGPGSVNKGIQVVQYQKISVTKKSLKTIKAYRNFMWARDKNGQSLQKPDDSVHEWSNPMDATRYAINTLVKPSDYVVNPGSILDVIRENNRPKKIILK